MQVDRNVVAHVEPDHLRPGVFHEVAELTGRRPEFEHAPALERDVPEIFGFATAQVPRAGNDLTVRQLDRVIKAAVAARQVAPLVGERLLILGTQLTEITVGAERRPSTQRVVRYLRAGDVDARLAVRPEPTETRRARTHDSGGARGRPFPSRYRVGPPISGPSTRAATEPMWYDGADGHPCRDRRHTAGRRTHRHRQRRRGADRVVREPRGGADARALRAEPAGARAPQRAATRHEVPTHPRTGPARELGPQRRTEARLLAQTRPGPARDQLPRAAEPPAGDRHDQRLLVRSLSGVVHAGGAGLAAGRPSFDPARRGRARAFRVRRRRGRRPVRSRTGRNRPARRGAVGRAAGAHRERTPPELRAIVDGSPYVLAIGSARTAQEPALPRRRIRRGGRLASRPSPGARGTRRAGATRGRRRHRGARREHPRARRDHRWRERRRPRRVARARARARVPVALRRLRLSPCSRR